MFVESVLRFGLPVNFQGMVLLPQKKTTKKLRDTLNQLYSHLDAAAGGGSGGAAFDVSGMDMSFIWTFQSACWIKLLQKLHTLECA